ncbi:MAG TPA: acyl-CoA thioesterase [Myxococcota bacterium]|nr:acyl-CoA thioesterase [Myxococcota bacterium]HNH49357.1 acyl-CoA thioesterase [Myxococcota bacterium]
MKVPPASTRVEMTQIVLPEHTNARGTIFGGQVAAWIDISAAISAQRFCRRSVVTASIDELHFLHPIHRGHIAIFQAVVNCAWKHSMEVGVRVEGEDPLTGQRTHTASAYLTFVALDEDGRPVGVPALDPQSAEELRREREAERRRARRLEYKKQRMVEEG